MNKLIITGLLAATLFCTIQWMCPAQAESDSDGKTQQQRTEWQKHHREMMRQKKEATKQHQEEMQQKRAEWRKQKQDMMQQKRSAWEQRKYEQMQARKAERDKLK